MKWLVLACLTVVLGASSAPAQLDRPNGLPADTSLLHVDSTDSLVRPVQPQPTQADLPVVRRTYKYRRQVGLAIFMMLFVAVALTTTQTYNPK